MKKRILSTCLFALMGVASAAQTQFVTVAGIVRTYTGIIQTTIQEVKSISGENASCRDLSYFNAATVQFAGRAVMSGNITYPATTIDGIAYSEVTTTPGVFPNNGSRHVNVLRAGSGPYSTILIRPVSNVMSEKIRNEWQENDSLIVVGTVDNFAGMAQFNVISFTLAGSSLDPKDEGRNPVVISNLGLLNDANFNNNLAEGEKYEAAFIEVKDIQISGIVNFASNRYNILLRDKEGNRVAVSDRFMGGASPKYIRGGQLKLPVVGARYKSIKGIVYQAKRVPTGCLDDGGGAATFNEAGYQLHPFHPSHFELDPNVPPIISDISINPLVPTSTSQPIVSANIVSDKSTITGAFLYYSLGDTLNYTKIPMTSTGVTYKATISNAGFTDGKILYYFIEARDANPNPLVSFVPGVSVSGIGKGLDPPFATVIRDNGLKISDIQYTPFANGNSFFIDKTVTVTGVATASTKDLGNVVIQEEGATEWGAIFLDNSAVLSSVKIGDKFKIAGTVEERSTSGSHRFTILKDIKTPGNELSVPIISSGNVIAPLIVSPNSFSGFYNFYKHEKFEAMFVEVANPDGGKLFVVDTNADFSNRFAEYRIGTEPVDPSLLALTGNTRNTAIPGLRVLAGRTTTANVINSYNFSLITKPAFGNPNVNNITVNGIDVIPVQTDIFMDKLRGIMQHSFSNMKILPRNNADAVNPSIALKIPTTLSEAETLGYSIFPNPTSNNITIQVADEKSFGYEITDPIGSLVANGNQTGNTTLSLGGKSKGLYFVKITDLGTGNSAVTKLIVE